MGRGTLCSPPRFFWPEENVVKMGVETAPTVFEGIITRMVKLTEEQLRSIIREELETEQLKNLHSKHEATVDSKRVLEMMAKSKGVMQSIKKIDNARELAGLLEAIIDASSVGDKGAVLKALMKVQGHEKKG
jgi:hypothetical protein